MTTNPLTGIQPLLPDAAAKLLRCVVDECKGRLVFFDLDSTLLDNRPRNAVIMRQFAEMNNQQALGKATAEHFPNWSARHSMALLGLHEKLIDTLIDRYMSFWEERFFTSEYCQYDIGIAGAVEFVNAIHGAGGIVKYLTGRNETMRYGTQACLDKLGFPVPGQDNVFLLMKPRPGDSDDAFKHDTLKDISETDNIVAGFDNEPTHINYYRSVFPDAHSVHLNTDHSMRDVKLLDGVLSISDFGDMTPL